MTRGVARQAPQSPPNPNETASGETSLIARLEFDADHFIAEATRRMQSISRLREQDKTADTIAIAQRPVTFHHVAKSANHGA